MRLTAVLIPAEEGGFVAFNPETGTTTQGESVPHPILDNRTNNVANHRRLRKMRDVRLGAERILSLRFRVRPSAAACQRCSRGTYKSRARAAGQTPRVNFPRGMG